MLSVTNDAGHIWQDVRQVSWPIAQMEFTPDGTGYVLASEWNPARQNYDFALVSTSDGGDSWQLLEGNTR